MVIGQLKRLKLPLSSFFRQSGVGYESELFKTHNVSWFNDVAHLVSKVLRSKELFEKATHQPSRPAVDDVTSHGGDICLVQQSRLDLPVGVHALLEAVVGHLSIQISRSFWVHLKFFEQKSQLQEFQARSKDLAGSMMVQKKKPLMVPPELSKAMSTHAIGSVAARWLMLGDSPLKAIMRLMTSKTGNFSLKAKQGTTHSIPNTARIATIDHNHGLFFCCHKTSTTLEKTGPNSKFGTWLFSHATSRMLVGKVVRKNRATRAKLISLKAWPTVIRFTNSRLTSTTPSRRAPVAGQWLQCLAKQPVAHTWLTKWLLRRRP